MINIKQKISQGWGWVKKQWKKVLVIIGIGVAIAAVEIALPPEQIPTDLQLKVAKEKIWVQKTENGIVTYFYQGDLIESESNEIVSKRTYNARFYETGKPNKVSMTVSVGAPYSKNEKGEWRWFVSATTTEDYFKKQTETTFLDRILGEQVFANGSTTYQVGASADDGRAASINASYFTITGTSIGVGFYLLTVGTFNAWYRFTGITIPQGSTIDVAYLSLYEASSAGSPKTKIWADDQNDPLAPTTNDGYWAITATTTAGVDMDGDPGVNDWYDSPSIVSVIQELVTSYDYSNEAIQILHKDDRTPTTATAYRVSRSYNNTTSPANTWGVKLHIEWTTGVAADEPDYGDLWIKSGTVNVKSGQLEIK